MASASDTLSLCKILSESKRIIRDHLHHFQALVILFVFPLSLCFMVYPTILSTFYLHPNPTHKLLQIPESIPHLKSFLLRLVSLLSLCAVASISYSTYNGFDGQPVSLIASIKSFSRSFWPILYTILVSELIGALIFIPFIFLGHLVYKWLDSSYFLPFVIFIGLVVCVVVLIYVQVNWILAYAVVVVESKWGYEPLRRSADLIKGNRGVALSMLLFFGIINGGFFLCFYGTGLRSSAFLLYLLFGTLYLSLFFLLNFVGTMVLYVLCREKHEGLPFEDPKKCSLLK